MKSMAAATYCWAAMLMSSGLARQTLGDWGSLSVNFRIREFLETGSAIPTNRP
jgi:hypothetical protein